MVSSLPSIVKCCCSNDRTLWFSLFWSPKDFHVDFVCNKFAGIVFARTNTHACTLNVWPTLLICFIVLLPASRAWPYLLCCELCVCLWSVFFFPPLLFNVIQQFYCFPYFSDAAAAAAAVVVAVIYFLFMCYICLRSNREFHISFQWNFHLHTVVLCSFVQLIKIIISKRQR